MEKKEKKENIFIANSLNEVKMIYDPYRLKILRVLHKKGKEMTVKQTAEVLKEAPNKVHYHMKKLFDFGVLNLVRTENINGIIAKYYNTKYDGYIIGNEGKSDDVKHAKEMALMNALDDASIKFKKDMSSYIDLVAEQGEKAQRGLQINYITLYMTKDEKEEFSKAMWELIDKYSKEDKEKEIYTTIQTLARIK